MSRTFGLTLLRVAVVRSRGCVQHHAPKRKPQQLYYAAQLPCAIVRCTTCCKTCTCLMHVNQARHIPAQIQLCNNCTLFVLFYNCNSCATSFTIMHKCITSHAQNYECMIKKKYHNYILHDNHEWQYACALCMTIMRVACAAACCCATFALPFVCPTHIRFLLFLRLISSYIFYNKIHNRKFTTKKIQQKIKIKY